MQQPAPVVEMIDIRKRYPGVEALKGVSLSVRPGEARALVGENGAGKSTLIKMLTGAESPSSGSIRVDGEPVARMTPAVSEDLGIACVYQNLVLAEHLTVAENIWMGRLPTRRGWLDVSAMTAKTDAILEEIGYAEIISPGDRVKDLTASQQGMVAIVRALSRDARVVVFDEPTAVLAEREVRELFKVIDLLKRRNIAIIYISHRLEEIFEVCDTISVLKDGASAGEATVAEADEDSLIAMMVGRQISRDNYDPSRTRGGELLAAKGVTSSRLRDCSFSVHEGEIVGVYGLVGAGRTELARAVFGADPIDSGSFAIRGEAVRVTSPRAAIEHGMALVPEDRRRHGLALQLSVKHNLNLTVYRSNNILGFIRTAVENLVAAQFIDQLRIRTPGADQKVKNLSGGNQQKVVVGKWLAEKARVFIMDEPTNGIDVGAKQEIYALMNELARQGSGIFWVSSHMPELMDICDRILVMRNGSIVADVARDESDEEKLLALAIRD
ncbi:MAG: sugar ABC transporter ATP-binding protein [Planctomycetota bacterium]|jgi:ribose transport system ATP-binding protein